MDKWKFGQLGGGCWFISSNTLYVKQDGAGLLATSLDDGAVHRFKEESEVVAIDKPLTWIREQWQHSRAVT